MSTHRTDSAVATFTAGFSCSQAVFSAFAEDLGLDRDTVLKISTAFGGGIAGMGLTCGAVTGALMAIGARYGRIDPADEAAKQKTYDLAREFARRFTGMHGSIACRDLLGYDISAPEGKQQAEAEGLFKTRCPRLVADAVEILDGIIGDGKKNLT